PDAEVLYSYSPNGSPLGRSGGSVKTGKDGVAHLSASPAEEYGVTVEAAAAKHFGEQKCLTPGEVAALAPAPLIGHPKDGPPTVVVALYAEPRPSVELVVPDGYRGVVAVEIVTQEGAGAAGERRFVVEAAASGKARLVGPPVLRWLNVLD